MLDLLLFSNIKKINKMQIQNIINLCKKRGFVYQSSIIYGGLKGLFDYGPLGVELKNNIKKLWWRDIVQKRSNIYGLDAANIVSSDVLEQSGHKDGFVDIFIDCKKCKGRFRDDEIKDICLKCGSKDLSEPRKFNLMMHVNFGPLEGEYASLRPETAQSIFINFKNICDSFSPKFPFGIAQIGKAYRNEVTPRNFIFRSREFEQMEMEFFVKEEQLEEYFKYWKEARFNWWKDLGLNVQYYDQKKEELAHYSNATTDIVVDLGDGFEELEGIANRGDFDLGSHTKSQSLFKIKSKVKLNNKSTEKLCYFKDGESFVPSLVEISAGVDRAFLAILYNSYKEEEGRFFLKLPFCLAPIKVAIIPLVKKNEMILNQAKAIYEHLNNSNILPVELEITNNIGKAYKKYDEIGTPFCITVDFDSLEDQKITIRYRDTTLQERVDISNIADYFKNVF